MDDHALLEAWRGGDHAAGQQLFARHFDSVYWFFSNKIDRGADDLAQDTFLALVRHRETVGRQTSFRAYLFAVARSKLIDELRRRGSVTQFDPLVTSVIELGSSVTSMLDARRRHQRLLSVLRTLPLDLQIVLELRFFEQLSGPELAEILGIPEGTARSRLRRAMELVRERLVAAEDAVPSDDDMGTWIREVRAERGGSSKGKAP